MPKKGLIGLAPTLALIALAMMPATALALKEHSPPKVFVSGVEAGQGHRAVFGFGEFVLENKELGYSQCNNLIAGSIWNEETELNTNVNGEPEKHKAKWGLGEIEAYKPYDCKHWLENLSLKGPCAGEFLTAELPLEATIKEGKAVPLPRKSSLPWPTHLIERTEKGERTVHLYTEDIRVNLVAPCLGKEIIFEGSETEKAVWEPLVVNGSVNGLHPSQLVFNSPEHPESAGGYNTGHLFSKQLVSGENLLYTRDVNGSEGITEREGTPPATLKIAPVKLSVLESEVLLVQAG